MVQTVDSSTKVYPVVSLILFGVCVLYAGVKVDAVMSLHSSPTITAMFYYFGVSRIAGFFAVGILAVQIGLIHRYRPDGSWKMLGGLICVVSALAIMDWLGNAISNDYSVWFWE